MLGGTWHRGLEYGLYSLRSARFSGAFDIGKKRPNIITVMVSGTSAAPSVCVCVYIYSYIYIYMYVLRFNNKRPAPFEDKTIQ